MSLMYDDLVTHTKGIDKDYGNYCVVRTLLYSVKRWARAKSNQRQEIRYRHQKQEHEKVFSKQVVHLPTIGSSVLVLTLECCSALVPQSQSPASSILD